MNDLMTTAQVARQLGYTRETVNRAARAGELVVAFQMPTMGAKNGSYLFTPDAVKAWRPNGRINARRAESNPW